jgi:hypothetical protein
MKPIIRQSDISTIAKCGLYYKFKVLDKIEAPSTPKMTVGTVLDLVNNTNLIQKIKSGNDISIAEAKDLASDFFESKKAATNWRDESPDQIKDQTVRMAETYIQTLAPTIDPETVQEGFQIETDLEFDIAGTIDYVDKSGVVRDLKTSSAQMVAKLSVNTSIQASFYWYAYKSTRGKDPSGFQFDIIERPTKTKAPQCRTVSGQVTNSNLEFAFYNAQAAYRSIKEGIFIGAPEYGFWCSKSQCPFWDQCRGKK